MATSSDWAFPNNLQPRADEVDFDLQTALDAVVQLRAEVPEDAFTASTLGTERIGSGIVIRNDGLVLTIGYLITEAASVWLTMNKGVSVEAYPVAYDQVTGFGLVMPLRRLDAPILERGSARSARIGDEVIFIGHGGRSHALKASIVDKREFAGYWEYLLEEALFTAPAHPEWGGAALVDSEGQLLGIGSLFVQETRDGNTQKGNMIVPIDLLDPILDDLLQLGRPARPPRPWLGLYAVEAQGHLVVSGVAKGSPADRGGVHLADLVHEVAGSRIGGLADFFRKVWALGEAGVEVPLTVSRDGKVLRLRIRSGDRRDYLKKPQLH